MNQPSPSVVSAVKWTFRFILIGIIAGLGSIAFQYLCILGQHFFLDVLAGYRPPVPAGEVRLFEPTIHAVNPWILLFLPALGGLLSGWLVYTFAPEAEGAGADAAIDAFHNKGGYIRGRVPFIKTLASALIMTTGGSGGKEGPIAHIGGGFGSFLASRLNLSDRERRIMMAAGIGAGVGSIFRAPLAGALFAAEFLYRDPEFESDVIIPAGISSVVAYCLFCLVFGWGSLFESSAFHFTNPAELGPYLVLSLALSATGIGYIKSFHTVAGFFKKINVPKPLKPAIGGLATGVIGFFLPQALSFGYGFAQQALNNELTVSFLLLLIVGKILTTSFSVGSGGSAGLLGPSVVIGGAAGGVVGQTLHAWMPGMVAEPGAFVIVGMAGFFTVVSNTPISTIIFVGEMTSSYHLLLPSLLVCSVSYLLTQKWTIFGKQVANRLASPAHSGDFFVDILATIKVKDLMPLVKKVDLIPQDMNFLEFKKYFQESTQHYFPVVDNEKRLVGIFSVNDIRSVIFSSSIEHLVLMKDIGTSEMMVATPSEDLNAVLKKFTLKNIDGIPVVEEKDHQIILGMLYRREVIGFYNKKIEEMKDRIGESSG